MQTILTYIFNIHIYMKKYSYRYTILKMKGYDFMIINDNFDFNEEELFREVEPKKEGIFKRFLKAVGMILWTIISIPVSLIIIALNIVFAPFGLILALFGIFRN